MGLIAALFIALMVCSATHAKPIRSQWGKVIAKEPYRAKRGRKNFSDQRQKKSVIIKRRRRGNIGTIIPRAQKKKIKKPTVKKKTTKTNEHNRLLLLWIQDVLLRGQ